MRLNNLATSMLQKILIYSNLRAIQERVGVKTLSRIQSQSEIVFLGPSQLFIGENLKKIVQPWIKNSFGYLILGSIYMAQTCMASSLKPLKALKRWKTRQHDIKKQRFSSKSFYFNELIDQASKTIKNGFEKF